MDVKATCPKCDHLMVDHLPHGKELLCPELIIPVGMREEFLEQTLAFILGQSMQQADGDQAMGVGMALKRAWLTGFKTGQSFPAKLH